MKSILINILSIALAVFMIVAKAQADDPSAEFLEQQIELRGVCVYICDQPELSVELPKHKCDWRYDGEASKPDPVHQESGALAIVAELLGKAETYYQTTGQQLNFLTKWTYDGVCSEKRQEA